MQLLIGHGHARVEASSNHHLSGDFRLGASEEHLLVALGFRNPCELDAECKFARNFWFDQVDVDTRHGSPGDYEHVDHGYGIPHRLSDHDRGVRRRGTVRGVLVRGVISSRLGLHRHFAAGFAEDFANSWDDH